MRISSVLALAGLVSFTAAAPVEAEKSVMQSSNSLMQRATDPVKVQNDIAAMDTLTPKYILSGNLYAKWHPDNRRFAQQVTLGGLALILQLWVDTSGDVHWIIDKAFPGGGTGLVLGLVNTRTKLLKLPMNMMFGQEYVMGPDKLLPGDVWRFFWPSS